MKRKLLGIIIILIVLAVLGSVYWFFYRQKSVEIKNIKVFSFSYSAGSMANSGEEYMLEWEDGTYIAKIKPDGISSEYAECFPVDERFVEKLEKFLNDNNIGAWNGFSKYDKHILDGDTFCLNICLMDGTSLQANGYMRWPKNYSVVRDGIEAIFNELIPGT